MFSPLDTLSGSKTCTCKNNGKRLYRILGLIFDSNVAFDLMNTLNKRQLTECPC